MDSLPLHLPFDARWLPHYPTAAIPQTDGAGNEASQQDPSAEAQAGDGAPSGVMTGDDPASSAVADANVASDAAADTGPVNSPTAAQAAVGPTQAPEQQAEASSHSKAGAADLAIAQGATPAAAAELGSGAAADRPDRQQDSTAGQAAPAASSPALGFIMQRKRAAPAEAVPLGVPCPQPCTTVQLFHYATSKIEHMYRDKMMAIQLAVCRLQETVSGKGVQNYTWPWQGNGSPCICSRGGLVVCWWLADNYVAGQWCSSRNTSVLSPCLVV